MASAKALLSAVESRGAKPPKPLTNLVAAHQLLTSSAEAPADPAEAILAAAEEGALTLDSARELATAGVIDRQVGEYLSTVAAQSQHKFLLRFHERLDAGCADEILDDALRPEFEAAATALATALESVNIDATAESLRDSASPEQLQAWRSLPAHIAVLSGIAGIATQFGMHGDFPLIQDPRDVAVQLQNGQYTGIHDAAILCCDGDLMQASRVFSQPSPVGDVRSSPWVRVTPRLWSIAEARERVREDAERVWAVMDSGRPKSGRLIDGEIVYDKFKNPFAKPELAEAKG